MEANTISITFKTGVRLNTNEFESTDNQIYYSESLFKKKNTEHNSFIWTIGKI